MTHFEKFKKELIEEIKNKSLLDIAFLVKQTPEFKDKPMEQIVKFLESEEDTK